jgi:putative heme-binding domain-containing protein
MRTRLLAALTLLLTTSLARAADAPVAEWIWLNKDSPDGEVVLFRKEFTVDGDVKLATLLGSCDNQLRVYLNGDDVAASEAWETPAKENVTRSVKKGRNVLSVRGKNNEAVAGLLIKLDITLASGRSQTVVTDTTWQATDVALPRGWWFADYEPKPADGWRKTISHGKYGMQPWGDFAQASEGAGALPADQIKLLPGFRAELLYSVPRDQGSWVSMTFDNKGRIITSHERGALYRVTLPTDGKVVAVEKLDPPTVRVNGVEVDVGAAQGLLYAFDSLYVMINRGNYSGMYRLRDTDGDDRFDKAELLKKLEGAGEHGPHAIVLSPDGRSLYCVAGNFTQIPSGIDLAHAAHRNWAEDILLPRMPDGGGHDPNIMAPGGWVARTDPDGKSWSLLCAGLRNTYDIAFNPDGELFGFDSDMEWDTGTSWYRPTRINHLVSGAEFGWRNGSGKWPAYYPDSLGGINIGWSSPTGIAFGTDAHFPDKYRRALFACDWAYGKMYAVHLAESGSGYTGTFEEFLSGKPLPLTDVAIGPDGAMYFTIGGRGTQSGLYRVRYAADLGVGHISPIAGYQNRDRDVRHKLEAYHTKSDPPAIDFAWPYLDSPDRNIRYAARVAVEHQDPKLWQTRALAETRVTAVNQALVALARVGPKEAQGPLLEALGRIPLDRVSEEQALEALRVYGLAFIRMGRPDTQTAAKVLARLDPLLPSPSPTVNRELCQLLVYLESPTVVAKSMKLLGEALTQEEQVHYVVTLRNAKQGWTPQLRRAYFGWINLAQQKFAGGHSFRPFLDNVRRDAVATLNPDEKKALEDVLKGTSVDVALRDSQPRQFVHNWQMEDIVPLVDQAGRGRNFESGRAAFEAAQCLKCHRFNGEGGSTGPDLSGVGNRFNARDLLESILLPSKVVSDQYQNVRVATDNDVVVGRIERDEPDRLVIRTHPLAGTTVEVKKSAIKDQRPDKLSMMPEGLVSVLKKEEVLDLLAYLRSGANPRDVAFQK